MANRDYNVDKKSIGQYINLVDKNANKIFTGHVLADGEKRYKVYAVNGGFAINLFQSGFTDKKEAVNFYESVAERQVASYIKGNCEVIGNIYNLQE